MADQKISQLTALTGANAADDDALAIVDTSAVETKKITRSELFTDTPTLLVGTTSADNADAGFEARSDGRIFSTATSNSSFNRLSSDGAILTFQKDTVDVGIIGTEVADTTLQADLYIHGRSTVGGTNANNSRLWLLGGDSGIILDGHTNAILPTDENSYEDARTDIGSADYRFKRIYLSDGVVFGGAVNSGGVVSSSNTLDDYEEGTWTPNINTGYTSPTYSIQHGTYTKIGDTVRAYFRLDLSGGTAVGTAVKIGGLPFTVKADADEYPAGFGYINATASLADNFFGLALQATTNVAIYTRSSTTVTAVAGTTLGNNLGILYTVIYRTNA